jgi:hypothetical protein
MMHATWVVLVLVLLVGPVWADSSTSTPSGLVVNDATVHVVLDSWHQVQSTPSGDLVAVPVDLPSSTSVASSSVPAGAPAKFMMTSTEVTLRPSIPAPTPTPAPDPNAPRLRIFLRADGTLDVDVANLSLGNFLDLLGKSLRVTVVTSLLPDCTLARSWKGKGPDFIVKDLADRYKFTSRVVQGRLSAGYSGSKLNADVNRYLVVAAQKRPEYRKGVQKLAQGQKPDSGLALGYDAAGGFSFDYMPKNYADLTQQQQGSLATDGGFLDYLTQSDGMTQQEYAARERAAREKLAPNGTVLRPYVYAFDPDEFIDYGTTHVTLVP